MSNLCKPTPSGNLTKKVVFRQALSFLYPSATSTNPPTQRRRWTRTNDRCAPPLAIEAWFFGSLAHAAKCTEHKSKPQQSSTFFTPQRPGIYNSRKRVYTTTFRKSQHTGAYLQVLPIKETSGVSFEDHEARKELLALVNQYEGISTALEPLIELKPRYQPADGPHLTVSDKIEDEWPPLHHEWPANDTTKGQIRRLNAALAKKSTYPEVAYRLYKELPEPRAPYLPAKTRHKLLRHLTAVGQKDETSMLRYFSVINDLKSTAIPLSVHEWNSAISFAARWVSKSSELEVEAALHIWRDMEHIAGVQGNEVTFNILFDVACKAGKFTLAEMMYSEMSKRDLPFTRTHHVSMIFLGGLRQDGDAVRRAFQEFEKSGEIIDTVVLNALVSSFARCNEPSQAEQIYNFMKEKATPKGPPTVTLDETSEVFRKKLTRQAYVEMGSFIKRFPDHYPRLQALASMSPDVHTYRILFNYFGVHMGDMQKTAILLDELIDLGIPLHGAHFLAFFKGFSMHGGIRYTEWTAPLLERTFAIFTAAINSHMDSLYVSKWMVLWVLRAFAKCVGQERMLQAWEDIKTMWEPSEDELDMIMYNIRRMMDAEDMAVKNRDNWIVGEGVSEEG